jgi:hypothetical protein
MRKILLLICMLLLPAILYAQPSIEFDGEKKDVGTVKAGDPIQHEFMVKNTGDKELIIDKLVPS